MTNYKTALLATMIAAAVSAGIIHTTAFSVGGRMLPMAAKIQDRLPQSDNEIVQVNLTTVSVVKDTDASKRLTVLTKTTN